jgi:uncharacterized protein (DUF302 family)
METVTRVEVEHVRLVAEKGFDEVAAAFLARLGTFDAARHRALLEAGDEAATRAELERMAGPSGFMLFGSQDHGKLLGLAGREARAVQYVVGNPLFAVEMTRHAVGAALYAPLRVLIHEVEPGRTCVEYDRPSSLFGQFHKDAVDEVAKGLDRKLKALIEAAVR